MILGYQDEKCSISHKKSPQHSRYAVGVGVGQTVGGICHWECRSGRGVLLLRLGLR